MKNLNEIISNYLLQKYSNDKRVFSKTFSFSILAKNVSLT